MGEVGFGCEDVAGAGLQGLTSASLSGARAAAAWGPRLRGPSVRVPGMGKRWRDSAAVVRGALVEAANVDHARCGGHHEEAE